MSLAVASCQSYHAGHYTAFQHMAEEDLDLVLHLGK
ncbi:alkaline phosphatase D family protein [Streptomyces sp. NPDC001292]